MSRILVIDDEPVLLDLYRMMLEAEGHEVVSAEQPYESNEEIILLRPDLIILDMMIGLRKGGLYFLRQLKSNEQVGAIPIVLCTAASLEREQEDYLQNMGVTVVYKPFDIDELVKLLENILAEQTSHPAVL